MRMWIALTALLAIGATPFDSRLTTLAQGRQEKKPNVLFLFTDDQRADTIHALGNAIIHTPNLDRLAESGFVFRNAYCMGGDVPAICTPSRYMLLSGLSLFHRKQASPERPNFPR